MPDPNTGLTLQQTRQANPSNPGYLRPSDEFALRERQARETNHSFTDFRFQVVTSSATQGITSATTSAPSSDNTIANVTTSQQSPSRNVTSTAGTNLSNSPSATSTSSQKYPTTHGFTSAFGAGPGNSSSANVSSSQKSHIPGLSRTVGTNSGNSSSAVATSSPKLPTHDFTSATGRDSGSPPRPTAPRITQPPRRPHQRPVPIVPPYTIDQDDMLIQPTVAPVPAAPAEPSVNPLSLAATMPQLVVDPETGSASVVEYSIPPHDDPTSFWVPGDVSGPLTATEHDWINDYLRQAAARGEVTDVTAVPTTTAASPTNPAVTMPPGTDAQAASSSSTTAPAASGDDAWSWDEWITWPADDLNTDLRSNGNFVPVSEAAASSSQGTAVTSAVSPHNVPASGPGNNNLPANFVTFNDDVPDNVFGGSSAKGDDPTLQSLLEKPAPGGRWSPQPASPTTTTTIQPRDAEGNPLNINVDAVLGGVEQVMRGFEADPQYRAQLALATTPGERAELARLRFRRCWQTIAVAEVAAAMDAGASGAAGRPILFVAGRDTLLETNEGGTMVRQRATWGWLAEEGRWAWIDEEVGGVFHPAAFCLVDMQAIADRHGIEGIYAQRFPVC
ncbi:uncharacterized protein PG986_002782 [Apiospora aurea]|uniref:Uncharacterized protein n=1 Tax=Apiospora aurea TaxID=335848 RepID=A0ABR1QPT1_9PEZI